MDQQEADDKHPALSAVSIMVSTTKPDAKSRIPLGRSQAGVSASDAGGFRPNDSKIRSLDVMQIGEPLMHPRLRGIRGTNPRRRCGYLHKSRRHVIDETGDEPVSWQCGNRSE